MVPLCRAVAVGANPHVVVCVYREVARVSFEVNSTVENIGARRLHTMIERVMEEISFTPDELNGEFTVTVRSSSLMLAASIMDVIL